MKKIALLFLTIDNHNKPDIWKQFLKNTNYFNIYCHPKNPSKVSQSFLKDNIIPELVETAWGELVLAYYNLLKYAFENKENYKFVYLSDSCIPIKNAETVYAELINDNATYIDLDVRTSKHDIEHRLNKHLHIYKKYGINKYNFIKHSGWFVLNRFHSQVLLSNEKIFKYFNKVLAGDEHILSILKANQMKLTPRIITCTKWDQTAYSIYKRDSARLWKMYDTTENQSEKQNILKVIKKMKIKMLEKTKHPKIYKVITEKDNTEFKFKKCLFIRKILPETNIKLVDFSFIK